MSLLIWILAVGLALALLMVAFLLGAMMGDYEHRRRERHICELEKQALKDYESLCRLNAQVNQLTWEASQRENHAASIS